MYIYIDKYKQIFIYIFKRKRLLNKFSKPSASKGSESDNSTQLRVIILFKN